MSLTQKQYKYGNYGYRFIQDIKDIVIQIDSVGLEKRETTDYYFDGLNRTENGCCLFQYTLSGTGTIEIGDLTYTLVEGDYFFVEIPSNHKYYLLQNSTWEYIYIVIYGIEANKRLKEIVQNKGVISKLKIDSKVIRTLFSIYEEAMDKRIVDSYQSSLLAYEFIMELCKASDNKHFEGEYPKLVNKAISLILKEYHKPIGVEEIAQSLNISKYHLIRQFDKYLGISTGKYLTKIRLEKAIELLNKTTLNIEDVALSVGFTNGNYFTKVFSSYIGMTPSDFRNKQELVKSWHLTI